MSSPEIKVGNWVLFNIEGTQWGGTIIGETKTKWKIVGFGFKADISKTKKSLRLNPQQPTE